MMSSLTTAFAHWPTLLRAVLWVLPLGYGAYLFTNEGRLRDGWLVQSGQPVSPTPDVLPQPEFNPDAVATVMGLASQTAAVHSTEPLTLRASFVASTGHFRALLARVDR